MDVIARAKTEWASTVVLVHKKIWILCYLVDYRKLNTVKVHDSYQIPCMDKS